MSKETNLYEIGYLLKSDLKEEDILAFSDKLRDVITKNGGLVLTEGKIQKKELAYPIKKEETALFNWVKFSISTDKSIIKEIKEYLDKQSEILRFLIIKTEEEQQKQITFKKRPLDKKIEELTNKAPETTKNETSEKTEEKTDTEKDKVKEEEIDKKIEELLGEN